MEPARWYNPRLPSWARRSVLRPLAGCLLLMGLFAALAFLAAQSKCPTFDEPLHAVAGYMHLHRADFHVNPEDPPLWKLWASLPNRTGSLNVPPDSPRWSDQPLEIGPQTNWSSWMLYTTGTDVDRFIGHARTMMLILGVALGLLTALWAGRIAGAAAAVAACTLFALDPNFMAHAPLIKNDVAISLVMLALAMAIWRIGQSATVWRILLVSLLVAIGLVTKFSGILLVPLLIILLLVRALLPWPWRILGRQLQTRWQRTAAAAAICLCAALISYLGIWACYDFRFDADPRDPTALAIGIVADQALKNEVYLRNPAAYGDSKPTDQQVAGLKPNINVRAVLWLDDHRLLPHAWLVGLLFTYQSSLVRFTYLLGQRSTVGWWYYFPLAMLFKTPLATQAAGVGALMAGIVLRVTRRRPSRSNPTVNAASARRKSPVKSRQSSVVASPIGAGRADALSSAAAPTKASVSAIAASPSAIPASVGWSLADYWTALCLAIPVVLYAASAVRSNLNLGLRHILPIYPFLFIAIGIAFSHALARWGKPVMISAAALGVGLAAASFAAFPNYIPFFNAAVTTVLGPHGGIKLLSDSNLDWGQDLILLANWQQQHPGTRLYLAYFGMADPHYYGVDYINLPGSYAPGKKVSDIDQPGVLAVSARLLQGIYLSPKLNPYAELNSPRYQPEAILGNSIYLYEWPPRGITNLHATGGP